ncbi:hypothetical protein JGH11_12900 [Dysgonomonas sp. Marseille-P4677]|uniref:hypothetical protein n=1 Tax=Dysgonomonas sp. Marseille-P4677 TaxID=2364790 RepID=UPI001913F89B|nr:hypothetical protein [Dysgonomonas sp. Marseille-P4677]MBK5721771.1 hypothetical protein [Dysgonomonas sp. Marseille-P4677]
MSRPAVIRNVYRSLQTCGSAKNLLNIYKGLASPVFFEFVQRETSGHEAEVSIIVKDNLPCYVLRGDKLVWKTSSGRIKSVVMDDLNPGQRYSIIINELDSGVKPEIRLIRPTGYTAAEY